MRCMWARFALIDRLCRRADRLQVPWCRPVNKLARPELFRLLADSQPADVLLVEQVDRLSRLTTGDWRRLKAS